jgi:hypothetical protein
MNSKKRKRKNSACWTHTFCCLASKTQK